MSDNTVSFEGTQAGLAHAAFMLGIAVNQRGWARYGPYGAHEACRPVAR